ncbi:MAG: glutamine synthetase family protein [Candidatus Gracilibacteria bacterium]|jgi:glutamine synthetase
MNPIPREHISIRFPRTNVTKEMVLKMAEEYNVQFIDFQFADLRGSFKAITIPIHKLEEGLDHGVWFDGSSVGFTTIFESDMSLRADLNTFAVLPWTLGQSDVTARLICDVYTPEGVPYEGCPRNILKRQIEEAKKMGFDFKVGPELEYFVFKRDAEGNPMPIPQDDGGYFDQNKAESLALRRHMSLALDMMGIDVERMHHEVSRGQNEVNFRYGDALLCADNALTFKFVLKALAEQEGLHVSFMPKPMFGVNGSGMHVHQSLFSLEDGKNKFYDPDGLYGLSMLAQNFIAGQFRHIRAMNAIMNPTVNSYKRLVVGYEAPVNVAWGQRNRSALIRIPRINPVQAEKASRIELRCPDPSCNPYLAFAVMLAAGLDGIRNNLPAPAPLEENIWELKPDDMEDRGITTVAGSLKEAIDAFAADELVWGVLGAETSKKFYKSALADWKDYRLRVTPWEIEKYLGY